MITRNIQGIDFEFRLNSAPHFSLDGDVYFIHRWHWGVKGEACHFTSLSKRSIKRQLPYQLRALKFEGAIK